MTRHVTLGEHEDDLQPSSSEDNLVPQGCRPVILSIPERDLRKQQPEPGKTGFTGKTQAELWAHLLATQPQLVALVGQLEAGVESDMLHKEEGDDHDFINRRVHEIKQALAALGIGQKVADNMLRVEMARLAKKYPTPEPESLPAGGNERGERWGHDALRREVAARNAGSNTR